MISRKAHKKGAKYTKVSRFVKLCVSLSKIYFTKFHKEPLSYT